MNVQMSHCEPILYTIILPFSYYLCYHHVIFSVMAYADLWHVEGPKPPFYKHFHVRWLEL